MKITQEQIDQFTDSRLPSPPMIVTVTKTSSPNVETYIVPASFQMDIYVNSLYPNFDLNVDAFEDRIIVSAMHNDEAIETHEGIFMKYHGKH